MKALKVFIFVIVMGTAAGGLLAGVDSFTRSTIERNKDLKLKSAVLDVLEIGYDKENILSVFGDNVKEKKIDKYVFYTSKEGAVAFRFEGPGLWGPIAGIASVNPDLKTIKTIKIIHQEETPGLGGRIGEEGFLGQFRGKEFFPKIVFMPQGKASGKNEVDAITGATGSSKALEKLLNEALEKNIEALKKGA